MFRDNKILLLDERLAAVEEAREEGVLILMNFYKSEEIFLNMWQKQREIFPLRGTAAATQTSDKCKSRFMIYDFYDFFFFYFIFLIEQVFFV